MANFKGFNDQQKEVLARKIGYKGDMSTFDQFLQQTPAALKQFKKWENKAQEMVSGVKTMAEGGDTWFEDYQRNREQPAQEQDDQPAPTQTPQTPQTPTRPNNTPVQTGSITVAGENAAGGEFERNIPFVAPNMQSSQSQRDTAVFNNAESFVPQVEVDEMRVSQNELIDRNAGSVGPAPQIKANTATAVGATAAPTTPARTVTTELGADKVEGEVGKLEAAQGTVSQQAQVEAAQALPSADATIQGQLTKLMSQFEGGNMPPWAAGAMRMANTVMADRGMGSSTMAAGAIQQAAMESAISIAAQDAATFSAFEMKNLDNRQQARLVNAQSFLQMDLANLDNRQQTALFKSQAMINTILSDTAAENASRQFNATSQQQTDQFFAGLKTQVSQFNAGQKNAMRQFNTDQINSVRTFNAQMRAQRQQFNAANRLIIAQSNAQWRRSVTTANNASQNEANRLEAQSATQMTMASYENMMQRERDFYSFAFTAGENAQERTANVLLAQMGADADSRAGRDAALGALAGAVANGAIGWAFGD